MNRPRRSSRSPFAESSGSRKPIFPEDVAQPRESFFLKFSNFFRDKQYEYQKDKIEFKLEKLSPVVKKLMEREDMETLTREERDVVADWVTLNQNLHTYRRRKFFAESGARIAERRMPTKSQWEEIRESLEEDIEKWRASHLPGGTRAQLWSQEIRYRQAEEFSRTTHRMRLAEGSFDTNKVDKSKTRLHHLEPAFPPSYQARAAAALKLEDKAYNKQDNVRLQRLIERHDMENPLDRTLRHLDRTSRRYFSSSRPIRAQEPSTTSTPPVNPSDPNTDQDPNSFINKFRVWFAKNGPLGVTLFLTYSAIDLTLIYLLLSTGVDISSLLAYVGVEKGAGAATFAVAYALHKMLAPARAGLVLFTMPYIKPTWDKLVSQFEKSELAREIQERVDERSHSSKK
jgi:hypothetical protein